MVAYCNHCGASRARVRIGGPERRGIAGQGDDSHARSAHSWRHRGRRHRRSAADRRRGDRWGSHQRGRRGSTRGPLAARCDADGLLVTPGVVDVHTHYDGQATWDPQVTPSSWHGVTTVVMGNCGVGFAPVRPGAEAWLVQLMEGVEDIPGTALTEGIEWSWESFPEYLSALERMGRVLDIGTQVPHGAVRAYVMGERGARNEPATPEDIEAMAALVKEGVAAGALGFSTSRTIVHRAVDGEPVPGTFAAEDELFGIGRALGSARCRRLRARARRGDGRGSGGAGAGGGMDAPPLGRHRSSGQLRPPPGGQRARPVARDPATGRRGQRRGCGPEAPGGVAGPSTSWWASRPSTPSRRRPSYTAIAEPPAGGTGAAPPQGRGAAGDPLGAVADDPLQALIGIGGDRRTCSRWANRPTTSPRRT